jgi:hypothetical protein
MVRSLRIALCLFAVASPLTAIPVALPAAAESPAKFYQYGERQFRNACRPPLKYAAGACVRRCPAGYQDFGRTCRFRTLRR